MAQSDLYGVSKFEVGTPGDGVMGTTLTEYAGIEKGSVVITMPEPEVVEIFTELEQVVPYRSIPQQSAGVKMEVKLYGVPVANYVDFFGGTYTSGTKTWDAPQSLTSIYKSVRVTTKETNADGDYLKIEMPNALVTAGIEGSLTSDSMATVKLTFTAQIPISALGVRGNPLSLIQVEGT
jgi:hypothetical protein